MNRYDIPPPHLWEDFENLCRDLWASLWEDPHTRRHGRQGQPQAGVDIYGRPLWSSGWHGVQCKVKSQISNARLTKAEIVTEVKKARAFSPPLASFTIATTGSRDVHVEELVRQISDEQVRRGSFPVTVSFWEDILEALQAHPELLRKHYRTWQRGGAQRPVVFIGKLPPSGENFVGREEELHQLDKAWAEGTNVIVFSAIGGAGKSALINQWLDRLKEDKWRAAHRVLGWTFSPQGTESPGALVEEFVEHTLDWLGSGPETSASPWKRGERLATLLREERSLLVLDGFQSLQYPPGPRGGKIKDPVAEALVKELAADNPGLCVITTHLDVSDIAGRRGVTTITLERLSAETGAELLQQLGVQGPMRELRAVADKLAGHGLALTLMGTFLRDICDGDIRRWNEVAVLDEGLRLEGSSQARQVIAGYERWFGPSPEIQVLYLLGLFDGPADPGPIAALRAQPGIPRLTEGIDDRQSNAWKAALARLRDAHLVAPAQLSAGGSQDLSDGQVLGAHPLVIEYFGERLKVTNPEAWHQGHDRLYQYYKRRAPEYPESFDEMLPLYRAVVHGCSAGKVQETCDEVLKKRILRGKEFFSWRKLGTFGAELTALAAFFDRRWNSPSCRLRLSDRLWLLALVGFHLRAVGRLEDAVQPTVLALEGRTREQDWENAAVSASALCTLKLLLGDVSGGVGTAKHSVDLADRSKSLVSRGLRLTTLANAEHQAGHFQRSKLLFERAEAMEVQQGHRQLHSLPGYRYCDLILSLGEPGDGSGLESAEPTYHVACLEVRRRAAVALEIAEEDHDLLNISLAKLCQARSSLGLSVTLRPAAQYLTRAKEEFADTLDTLREAGREDYIAIGLLSRAAFHRLAGNSKASAADLGEAEEIAKRGSMRLLEADIQLGWTRHHLKNGDPGAARQHLARTKSLVSACGYGRRQREVAWLENLPLLDEGATE